MQPEANEARRPDTREHIGDDPVSELRTLKRGREKPHVRCVQGRLSLLMGDDEAAVAMETESQALSPSETSRCANVFHDRFSAPAADRLSEVHPLAYRGVIAGWPVFWREQWGRRANELEETGLSWRDAEAQAFVEVWNSFRQGHSVLPLTASDPERN